MSDQRTTPQGPAANPWMRPLGAQQLIRNDQTRRNPEPVGPYTPNEPDRNEAIYAARAAAARQKALAAQQQAAAGQTASPEAMPISPVQQAVEQAAQQAHAARQSVYIPAAPLHTDPVLTHQAPAAPQAQPVQPAAVFYQQSTGVQQPPQASEPPLPAQPAAPHRLPMNQQDYPPAQPAARWTDAAVLADPMLAEEAVQETVSRRRSRMVMRQAQPAVQEPADLPDQLQETTADLLTDSEAAAQPKSIPTTEATLPPENTQPAEAAPQLESIPSLPQMQPLLPLETAPVENIPQDAPQPFIPGEPQAETAAEPDSQSSPQPDPQPLDVTDLPADFFDLPLENPLKGYDWYTEDPDDEDEPEEDCMDTSSMPVPAPVSTLDLPKVRRGKRLLTALMVLMLLAAAGAFLWLSGHGETIYHKAIQLVDQLRNPTVSTGPLNVNPDTAALPASLIVTVTTDQTISALKLVDDNEQELPAKITCTVQEDHTLWYCTLDIQAPYSGYLHTRLYCQDGQWRPGSEKRYVAYN